MIGACLLVYTVVAAQDISVARATLKAKLVFAPDTYDPNESVLSRMLSSVPSRGFTA
jgi:hypothetical protein